MSSVEDLLKLAEKLEKKAGDPNVINSKINETLKAVHASIAYLQSLNKILTNSLSNDEPTMVKHRTMLKDVGEPQMQAIKKRISDLEKLLIDTINSI